jgi:hypothetical protein
MLIIRSKSIRRDGYHDFRYKQAPATGFFYFSQPQQSHAEFRRLILEVESDAGSPPPNRLGADMTPQPRACGGQAYRATLSAVRRHLEIGPHAPGDRNLDFF